MKKFKVYIPDNPNVIGGWVKMTTIEAEDAKAAMNMAKAKFGEKVMIKEVK